MCRISTESLVIRIDIGCIVESRATPERKKFSTEARSYGAIVKRPVRQRARKANRPLRAADRTPRLRKIRVGALGLGVRATPTCRFGATGGEISYCTGPIGGYDPAKPTKFNTEGTS